MPPREIHLKAVIVIAVVFVALVCVHLWWGVDEGEAPENDGGLTATTVQITAEGQQIDLASEPFLTPGELSQWLRERIDVLQRGGTDERGVAAILLAYVTNDPQAQQRLVAMRNGLMAELEGALLACLNEADDVVSVNCRDALIGLWRVPPAASGLQKYAQALANYEAGNHKEAEAAFEALEQLWGSLPADLYRLKGEIALADGRPAEAVEECQRAVAVQPNHFLAHYVLASAYEQEGDHERALKSLDACVKIYARFPDAEPLRLKIRAAEGERP